MFLEGLERFKSSRDLGGSSEKNPINISYYYRPEYSSITRSTTLHIFYDFVHNIIQTKINPTLYQNPSNYPIITFINLPMIISRYKKGKPISLFFGRQPQYLNHHCMRKVPSYPKITTKTNITVMQTQNININSPKAITMGFPAGKKIFKGHKSTTQKPETSQINQNGSRSKTKYLFPRPHMNSRRKSSGNLSKPSKIQDPIETSPEQPPANKQEIKKLEEKLKQLEKKIEIMKSQTKKKKEPSSQRSRSKLKDPQSAAIIDKKPSLNNFGKKKQVSSSKILKKTQSDKYLLRPPIPRKDKQSHLDLTSSKHEDSQLIHQFVTQVARKQQSNVVHKQDLKGPHCYYISSASESLQKSYLQPFKQHLLQSIQTFKYLQGNRKPSSKQIEKHSVHLPPTNFKHTIILDLDQTLIHCNENLSIPHDVTLKIKFPTGQKIDAGVNVRPYAVELLRRLSQICEVIVFTASHQCYANVVLDHLDPKRQFVSHRLFRPHCWQTEQGVYVKDLRVLKNRQMQNILLVDNAAYSYLYQPDNGIPILPYYDDREDQQLSHLIKYIQDLINLHSSNHETIKNLNAGYFKLSSYTSCENLEHLVGEYREIVLRYREMIL